jgi:L-asparaginase
MKNHILIVNTGGTFNKYYDPISGELKVDQTGAALRRLAQSWHTELEIIDIIGKDSLEMTNHDRLELLAIVSQSDARRIIVVHGTDTMDITAAYLEDAELEKCVVFTGAMVPYAIDPVEASANFASAYGYLLQNDTDGIYIAMHGLVLPYRKITKKRELGCFRPDTQDDDQHHLKEV